MEPEYGAGNLAAFKPVRSVHGTLVRVLESSSRDAAQVWVRVAEAPTFDSPSGAEASACLSIDAARMLRDQLSWMLDNHFMTKK